MEFLEFKDRLFKKAKEEGFHQCEVYFTNRESLNIAVYDGEVEKYNLSNTFGLSFRGLINDKMGYSYTEILAEDSIDMLVKNAKNGASAIESEDIQFIYEGDEEYPTTSSYSKDLEEVKAEDLISIALKLEKEAKDHKKVVNIGGCAVGYGSGNYGIYNTKGLELTNKSNLLTAYVVPIVEEENEKYDGTGYVTANSLKEVDVKKIASMGIEEALSRIGGKSIPSGKYKCIIKNEAMVSLLSTFAGIFSGDAAQKGLSLLKDKEGEVIASKVITLVDDPLYKNGLASTPFDDEGVATFKKKIINKGKLTTLLHNLKTANKAGIKTTGNGFKGSYASSVGISPTNLYIEKGEKTFDMLLEEVKEGVVITELAGLHSGANSITGEFSLAAKGFYIENGKQTYPIEQITIAGNFLTMLKDITMVGEDLIFPMSSVGSSSVIVEEISIAGK